MSDSDDDCVIVEPAPKRIKSSSRRMNESAKKNKKRSNKKAPIVIDLLDSPSTPMSSKMNNNSNKNRNSSNNINERNNDTEIPFVDLTDASQIEYGYNTSDQDQVSSPYIFICPKTIPFCTKEDYLINNETNFMFHFYYSFFDNVANLRDHFSNNSNYEHSIIKCDNFCNCIIQDIDTSNNTYGDDNESLASQLVDEQLYGDEDDDLDIHDESSVTMNDSQQVVIIDEDEDIDLQSTLVGDEEPDIEITAYNIPATISDACDPAPVIFRSPFVNKRDQKVINVEQMQMNVPKVPLNNLGKPKEASPVYCKVSPSYNPITHKVSPVFDTTPVSSVTLDKPTGHVVSLSRISYTHDPNFTLSLSEMPAHAGYYVKSNGSDLEDQMDHDIRDDNMIDDVIHSDDPEYEGEYSPNKHPAYYLDSIYEHFGGFFGYPEELELSPPAQDVCYRSMGIMSQYDPLKDAVNVPETAYNPLFSILCEDNAPKPDTIHQDHHEHNNNTKEHDNDRKEHNNDTKEHNNDRKRRFIIDDDDEESEEDNDIHMDGYSHSSTPPKKRRRLSDIQSTTVQNNDYDNNNNNGVGLRLENDVIDLSDTTMLSMQTDTNHTNNISGNNGSITNSATGYPSPTLSDIIEVAMDEIASPVITIDEDHKDNQDDTEELNDDDNNSSVKLAMYYQRPYTLPQDVWNIVAEYKKGLDKWTMLHKVFKTSQYHARRYHEAHFHSTSWVDAHTDHNYILKTQDAEKSLLLDKGRTAEEINQSIYDHNELIHLEDYDTYLALDVYRRG